MVVESVGGGKAARVDEGEPGRASTGNPVMDRILGGGSMTDETDVDTTNLYVGNLHPQVSKKKSAG